MRGFMRKESATDELKQEKPLPPKNNPSITSDPSINLKIHIPLTAVLKLINLDWEIISHCMFPPERDAETERCGQNL